MPKLQERFERVALLRGYKNPSERHTDTPTNDLQTDLNPLELEPLNLKLDPIELQLDPLPDINDIMNR